VLSPKSKNTAKKWTQKIQQEFVDPPKIQAAPQDIQFIIVDPPKVQLTHQKYNNKKRPTKYSGPFEILFWT
jgi:ssRNA-specific RNase YbeY (16S rRNA maturation enzyme)